MALVAQSLALNPGPSILRLLRHFPYIRWSPSHINNSFPRFEVQILRLQPATRPAVGQLANPSILHGSSNRQHDDDVFSNAFSPTISELRGLQRLWPQLLLPSPMGDIATALWHQCPATALTGASSPSQLLQVHA
eukprot:Gb_14643 [translate_table: standard]